ncbi:MAG: glycosyltransferase family 2 protein [Oscillatoria sp. PMC 1068.18]|nr:glycosyltransferase family 2 protein [Oscillatoria sp. PMC 1076.18]MEC4989443.1 glycosyltransferase family 2 protein [Oscillatoria sp. PMC 1068.18]
MAKISVCIPTFNRANLLKTAVESVFQQTATDWELIVCDDGSPDETPELMSRYQEKDERVNYLRHPDNIGKSNNMRSGFVAATGEYFLKFDDDDRLTPEFLAKTSAILDTHPEIDFVGTDHWIIDVDNIRDESATKINSQRWGRSQLAEGTVTDLLTVVFVRQSFQIGATLFRRETLQSVGYMLPNIQNCEDNDLFVRLALAGKRGYYLPEKLMEYRVHAEQQGINRAIPYLKDKINYLNNYQFESGKLENIRKERLAEAQLMLGLRLIEIGETQRGKELVERGKSASPTKAKIGLALSWLPLGVRKTAFKTLRKVKSS